MKKYQPSHKYYVQYTCIPDQVKNELV